MYLVDTNVLSNLSLPVPHAELRHWLASHSPELYLSAVTAAEVIAGIARLTRLGSTTKATALERWWSALEHLYSSRILPLGLREARQAGEFTDLARAAGQTPGFADVAIAATAAVNDLIVLTRNTKHFSIFPLKVIDPFQDLPS